MDCFRCYSSNCDILETGIFACRNCNISTSDQEFYISWNEIISSKLFLIKKALECNCKEDLFQYLKIIIFDFEKPKVNNETIEKLNVKAESLGCDISYYIGYNK